MGVGRIKSCRSVVIESGYIIVLDHDMFSEAATRDRNFYDFPVCDCVNRRAGWDFNIDREMTTFIFAATGFVRTHVGHRKSYKLVCQIFINIPI